jgi:hypothetical protein
MMTRRLRIAGDGDHRSTDVRDYVMDMIEQLARMAREAGEADVAIHLSAILAASQAGLGRRDR